MFPFGQQGCFFDFFVSGNDSVDGMFRRRGLDNEQSPFFPSPASPSELFQKLGGFLVRTEVLDAEKCVGLQDGNEPEVRKIKPLCHHLCPDENVGLPFAEFSDNVFAVYGALGGVAVQPGNPCGREQCRHFFLYFLRARPESLHFSFAFRAFPAERRAVSAAVAYKSFRGCSISALVQAEAHVAVGAFRYEPAFNALYGR